MFVFILFLLNHLSLVHFLVLTSKSNYLFKVRYKKIKRFSNKTFCPSFTRCLPTLVWTNLFESKINVIGNILHILLLILIIIIIVIIVVVVVAVVGCFFFFCWRFWSYILFILVCCGFFFRFLGYFFVIQTTSTNKTTEHNIIIDMKIITYQHQKHQQHRQHQQQHRHQHQHRHHHHENHVKIIIDNKYNNND